MSSVMARGSARGDFAGRDGPVSEDAGSRGRLRQGIIISPAERGIRYEHFPELAGRRRPKSDSINTAWHNAAFRGCADHMGTAEFSAGIEQLLNLTDATGSTAIMCAEAVWWHCHRGLIADFLKSPWDGSDAYHRLARDAAAFIHVGGANCRWPLELRVPASDMSPLPIRAGIVTSPILSVLRCE
jgi:hypothetical protein